MMTLPSFVTCSLQRSCLTVFHLSIPPAAARTLSASSTAFGSDFARSNVGAALGYRWNVLRPGAHAQVNATTASAKDLMRPTIHERWRKRTYPCTPPVLRGALVIPAQRTALADLGEAAADRTLDTLALRVRRREVARKLVVAALEQVAAAEHDIGVAGRLDRVDRALVAHRQRVDVD